MVVPPTKSEKIGSCSEREEPRKTKLSLRGVLGKQVKIPRSTQLYI